LRQAGALAARTALLGAPIMALMFVLFPRLGPLWGVPQDGAAITGLSNSMRMGSVAEIAQDDSVALRLRFFGPVPPPETMYFRGPVLGRFDGTEWKPLPQTQRRGVPLATELRVRGAPLRYEVTLEPSRLAVLPLLEATASAPDVEGYRVTPRDDLQWVTDRPVFERLRFEAQAYTDFSQGPQKPNASLGDFLELPVGYNPRTLEWAETLRRDPRQSRSDPRALAQAVLAHIRTARYTYTLSPGTYGETDPRGAIDEFWLDRREGFCEHFAAAFVVIMRAMGVPARVVTGYQGTEPFPVDGYYVVRQSSAHAWAEYWQPGEGWLRADPTAAVAPDRIIRSRRLAPPPGLVTGALGNMSPELLATLRLNWEAVNNRWNQWVLSYSRGQQLDLLKNLGFESPNWTDLAMLLILTLIALASGGAVWAWWDRRRVDPWVRQMESVRRCLTLLGIAADPHDPPRALAQRVQMRFGDAGVALAEMLHLIDRQRYSRAATARPDTALTRRFAGAARQLLRTR
jgi:transglutaminase-like putative cysteine protease